MIKKIVYIVANIAIYLSKYGKLTRIVLKLSALNVVTMWDKYSKKDKE